MDFKTMYLYNDFKELFNEFYKSKKNHFIISYKNGEIIQKDFWYDLCFNDIFTSNFFNESSEILQVKYNRKKNEMYLFVSDDVEILIETIDWI